MLFDFGILQHLHKFPLMMNLNMFHPDVEITKRLILRALSLSQTNFYNKSKIAFSMNIIHNKIKTFHYS